jgi:hypothetical protein
MMRLQGLGFGVFGAIGLISVVMAVAAVWLFVTDPVTVATAVDGDDVSPFIRDLANVLLEVLQGLLRYL